MQKETKEILWTCALSFLAGIIVTLSILGICQCFCKCPNRPHMKHHEMRRMYMPTKPHKMPVQIKKEAP